jgi:hypothetical protein
MRIRSIKPEFWRSDDITTLSWDERLLFVGMWSYVDDNGVGLDKLSAIVADLFAGDLERNAPETFARVSRGLDQLSEAGRIVRYTIDGRAYVEISNWDKHQRIDKPNKPRFPRSDAVGAEIRESVARVAEKVASGTGEQGNRGTGEQALLSIVEADERVPAPKHSGYSEAFLSWWSIYPRKESKGDAWKAWESLRKARLLPDREVLEAATVAYSRRVTDPQFRKLPAGWLRDRKWEDDESSQQRPNPDGWMNA